MSQALTADAIAKIEQMAIAAKRPEIVQPPGEPSHRYLVCNPDGTKEWIWAARKPQQVELATPAALAYWLAERAAVEDWEVYLDEERIVATDKETGRQRATVRLDRCSEWNALMEAHEHRMNQEQLLTLLSLKLRNTGITKELISRFRVLDWQVLQTNRQQKTANGDGYGKSLKAEVLGELPEEIEISIPYYRILPTRRYQLTLVVETHPKEGLFTLHTLPNQLEQTETAAQTDVRIHLEEELSANALSLTVHCGSILA